MIYIVYSIYSIIFWWWWWYSDDDTDNYRDGDADTDSDHGDE